MCRLLPDGFYKVSLVLKTDKVPCKQLLRVYRDIKRYMHPQNAETYRCEHRGDGTSEFSFVMNPHLSGDTQIVQIIHFRLALDGVGDITAIDVSGLTNSEATA